MQVSASTPPHATFTAPAIEELGPLFPGYHIDSLIACGGMGAVYLATQTSLDRKVAIKILPREIGSDEAFRTGFSDEARTMARLNHPNLVAVYDFGEIDGMLFIIMEFVAGQTLHQLTGGGAMDPREAARIMAGVCSGVAHAHENGVLHRDIKPANIIMDQHQRPKIGDFGLARAIGSVTTEGETIFGTPNYTAPEIIDRPALVDGRADIFSLGVVLHELLTGMVPAADPRQPSTICGCQQRFDQIIHTATRPNPEDRYLSAAEMGAELAQLASAPPGPRLQTGHTLGTAGRAVHTNSALRSPGNALSPAHRALGAPRVRPVVKKSEGSGAAIWAVLLVIGAILVAIFIVSNGPSTATAPKPPAGPASEADPAPLLLPQVPEK